MNTSGSTNERSDGEIHAAAVPTPDEIMADVQKRSLVMRVTTAYESGMGRGLSGRDLAQPYEPTCHEGIAYALGWYLGKGKQPSEPPERIPAVLFDGFAVFKELDERTRKRIGAESVAAVLDAVVRLLRGPALDENGRVAPTKEANL